MVVGDRQRFLSVLVTLKTEPNPTHGQPTGNKLAAEALTIGSDATTTEEAASDPTWLAYVEAGLEEANKSAVSNAAKVRKFVILPRDFTVPTGELGPTLKLKRPVVLEKQAAVIAGIYEAAAAGGGGGAGGGAGAGAGAVAAVTTGSPGSFGKFWVTEPNAVSPRTGSDGVTVMQAFDNSEFTAHTAVTDTHIHTYFVF